MHIDVEAVSSLCFVTTKLYLSRLLRSQLVYTLSLAEKNIGDNTRCPDCKAKGAVLCVTCSGSGLYVDSILGSQGIIIKVRCLGCRGTANIMCPDCGGRGHVGVA